MSVNTNTIVSASDLPGFSNYQEATFSAAYGGGNIAAGGFAGPIRAQTALNNSNAVSEVQVMWSGLESFYRLVPGATFQDYPTAGTRQYQVVSMVYYTGGNLIVDSYVVNQTGLTVSTPAITFNCRAFLYIAPFSI